MLSKVLGFADEFDMLPETGEVIACVSGGADSMCLLEALLEISRERGFTVCAAHFNHCLRGFESDRDEEFVREQCSIRGTALYTARGDVTAYAKDHGIGIEAAARDLRYAHFRDTAIKIGAVRIATAHTADDNAETMIFNLTRGTGTAGLSGIPPVRGMIIRPMLRVSRVEVITYLNERGVRFVEDSSNSRDVFTRNRLRHLVTPVLKGINPGFLEAVSSAAELSRADEEFLSELADEFIKEHSEPRAGCPGVRPQRPSPHTADTPPLTAAPSAHADDPLPAAVSVSELNELPFAVSSRVVRKLYGGNLSHKHVKAVLELCGRGGPPACLSLPGVTVYSEYGRVVFVENGAEETFTAIYPIEGGSVMIPELRLIVACKHAVYDSSTAFQESLEETSGRINKQFTSFLFKKLDLCGRMTVRSRREGDKISLDGSGCTKTLKKLFIERRIPARERALIPLIADDSGVLAVYGVGIGDRAVPQLGDAVIQIDFEEY